MKRTIVDGALVKTVLGAAAGQLIGRRTRGGGLVGAGLGMIATRIAARSIPGALIIGGGLIAKSVLDTRRERRREAGRGDGGAFVPVEPMAKARGAPYIPASADHVAPVQLPPVGRGTDG